ncbi:MAG: hypothetical protein LBJ71_04515 [Holosporaceae bacterium]|nr:hypothetical protein [Holosporaceae bacterium]
MKKVLLAAMLLSTQQIFAENNTQSDRFDGVYWGLGITQNFSKIKAKKKNEAGEIVKNVSERSNGLYGSVLLGSGKMLNVPSLYVGAEIAVDVSKTKHTNVPLDGNEVKLKTNGIIPSIGFIVGTTVVDSGFLVFLKVGLAHTGVSLNDKNATENEELEKISVSKMPIVLALGMQSSLSNKWRFRADVEFKSKTFRNNPHYKIENGHGIAGRIAFLRSITF